MNCGDCPKATRVALGVYSCPYIPGVPHYADSGCGRIEAARGVRYQRRFTTKGVEYSRHDVYGWVLHRPTPSYLKHEWITVNCSICDTERGPFSSGADLRNWLHQSNWKFDNGTYTCIGCQERAEREAKRLAQRIPQEEKPKTVRVKGTPLNLAAAEQWLKNHPEVIETSNVTTDSKLMEKINQIADKECVPRINHGELLKARKI